MTCLGMAYGRPSVEKMSSALPVVAEYCRCSDLAGIIDRACPVRADVAIVTHGQVIEALVADRLTSPVPLQRGHGNDLRNGQGVVSKIVAGRAVSVLTTRPNPGHIITPRL